MERMKINGMDIKEIRDVQDALAAFQVMNTTTETLVEELGKKAAEYTAIIESYDRNHSQYSEMIQALSEEQAKLQHLADIVHKMSQTTALASSEMLAQYKSNVQRTIDEAFRRVDDAAVHRSLQQTIEKSLGKIDVAVIDKAATAMNSGSKNIDRLAASMNNILYQIAAGVREFNDTVVNNFNKKALIATGAAALLFGLAIGYIAKSEMTADEYIDWTIDDQHRFFDDSKNANYLRFQQQEAEGRGDGYFYVKIKQFTH